MSELRIGCVADDFTGASDMASFLVKGGLNTEIYDGIPDKNWKPSVNTQALVIALKSRTEPTKQAVEQSLACFTWLFTELKVKQLYFKYCSTFDSTKEGNIGPVIDAVLSALNLDNAIISPALPINGRTVYQGHLFVNGIPLEHSSMRDHPLTPMKNSNILQLIEQQGQGKAISINHESLEKGAVSVKNQLPKLKVYQYLVLDHFNDSHAQTIADTFANHPFLSGSSGLAEPLAKIHSNNNTKNTPLSISSGSAPTLILAGSCSVATREQIDIFQKNTLAIKIDPSQLASAEVTSESIWQWVQSQQGKPCLIYSSDKPEVVSKLQNNIGNNVAQLLEQVFAKIATKAVACGVFRLIVAGGETSGAVIQALGHKNFFVGPSIAPGVPIIQPREFPELLLTLKSGNFGDSQFFLKALNIMNIE